jgi:hypothetical protein
MPRRIRALPIDARGYPVPWFVAWVDGVPDFRVVDGAKFARAIHGRRCWLCGEPLGSAGAFVIGPMCALTRTTSEPPSHPECAFFAIKACPFLTRPNAQRRSANLPEGWEPPAGEMLRRNPGVSVVWTTWEWTLFEADSGLLFKVGDPAGAAWFSEGRPATRAECEWSIETGLPLLLAAEPPANRSEAREAVTFLSAELEKTWRLLPGDPWVARSAAETVRAALSVATVG